MVGGARSSPLGVGGPSQAWVPRGGLETVKLRSEGKEVSG